MVIRTVDQLSSVDDPAWNDIEQAIKTAPVPVEVLSTDTGAETLYKLQVTTHSTLGALALNCGGLLIDHGWVRFYGGGSALPSIAEASGICEPVAPNILFLGHDVLGGRFAIDGGALGIKPGEVCYFSPDRWEWEGLNMGHTRFVHAFLSGATTQFYEPFRWAGWQTDTEALNLDQGFMLFPPLFTREGQNVEESTRAVVPLKELFEMNHPS